MPTTSATSALVTVRVIVVDASALLEFLLQTPLGGRIEARIFVAFTDPIVIGSTYPAASASMD